MAKGPLIIGRVTIALAINDEEILRHVNKIVTTKLPADGFQVVGQWTDLSAAFDIIKDYRPAIAVLGVYTADSAGVHALAEKISLSLPETQVFLISTNKDPETLLKAMRVGVKEYLAAPVDEVELVNALQRIKTAAELKASITGPCTIGVISTKGGSGCTTVAVNLAAALRLVTQRKVVILDVCGGGDVALFYNVKYHHTLKEVLENLDRLDSTLLKSYTVEHSSGVHIIPAIELGDAVRGTMNAFGKEAFQFLIHLLAKEYNYVIFDMGCNLSKDVIETLKMLDTILVVLQLELSALRNTRQDLLILGEAGLSPNTKLIVNRFDKRYVKGGSVISTEDVVKTLNTPVFCTIPNDYFMVSESINLGNVLVIEKRKSSIAQSFLRLAELITKGKAKT